MINKERIEEIESSINLINTVLRCSNLTLTVKELEGKHFPIIVDEINKKEYVIIKKED
jgi:hypothetical protein